MLNKEPNARSNIVILTAIAIASIALMLSILSYQEKIKQEEINKEIVRHDMIKK